MRPTLCFIIFLIGSLAWGLPHDVAVFHKPFWKNKPKAYKRLKENNEILVSAFTEEVSKSPQMHQMKVVAGGSISVPLEDTFRLVREYDSLSKADKHFQEVRYDKSQEKLYLHMAALGYHAKMNLKLKEVVTSKTREIHWLCESGSFKGMKGLIVLEALSESQTEISMTSDYVAEKLPLPKVLMGFGLEIIGRQVAQKMRSYILDKYKNS